MNIYDTCSDSLNALFLYITQPAYMEFLDKFATKGTKFIILTGTYIILVKRLIYRKFLKYTIIFIIYSLISNQPSSAVLKSKYLSNIK